MTLLSELIDIPTQVHKSDFVISLQSAVNEPEQTLRDYVVTPQLVQCFDRALSLIATSISDQKSKAAYLNGSFGAGKTAMMSVLHLLLQGEPTARATPELAPLVVRYAERIDGRRFLLVPFHFVGKTSMEQGVLGGYVDYVRKLHPEAPLPAVYVADEILEDAVTKRKELGEEIFFRVLSEGEVADEWGDYGASWDAARFEEALAAGPGSAQRDQLVGALLHTHHRAVPGQALSSGEGFIPLDAGLDAISRHARSLGYDALVLFLDELVLWLAARMSDVAFVTREGAKVVKLVESGQRPVPIVSFIARQRDLRELVGDHVPGAQSLTAIDVLRHSEGRFDTITLEDRNLAMIAERRLLRPRSEAARQALDDAFGGLRRELAQRNEADVLLTDLGDLADFRRLYPFSPALVEALVALSGAMQRERTALKVMAQLLVEGREHLQVGQLIPLGDLWDAVNAGDEPLTEVMRAQFAQARRLWKQRFEPVLLREHNLSEDEARTLPPSHDFITQSRLAKSLLIAALVPEAGPLRALTVSRLTALNSGTVRTFVPGTERQRVLQLLGSWRADIGELRLGEDEHDPTVSVALEGIDTTPLLDAAGVADNEGERRRRVRDMLISELEVKDAASFDAHVEVTWRGTKRRASVTFGNVRDEIDLPDEVLRAGNEPRIVIDLPWDSGGYTPIDDRGRIDTYLHEPRAAEWTAIWLPNHFTEATLKHLGKLVRLDHLLSGNTFENLATYLSPAERPVARAQLVNERRSVEDLMATALRQAYGVDPASPHVVGEGVPLGDQFLSLDRGLSIQPPVGASLRAFVCELVDRLYSHRYPGHPKYTELVTRAERVQTLRQVVRALSEPNGRLENVEVPSRKILTKVAGPLQLGTMFPAHFIADLSHWKDLIERKRAESGLVAVPVATLRQWLDGADTRSERRGLVTEDADLVILCYAAATDRSLVASGRMVTDPEIGRLAPDSQLVPEDLPSPADWSTARRRAAEMGIVSLSELLSASTVADLDEKLSGLLRRCTQGARDLAPRLDAALVRLGAEPDGDRRRTAAAALALVSETAARPGHSVEALARLEVPTTPAALGTSLEQAAAIAGAIESTNWRLLQNAVALTGSWTAEARAIRERLLEALRADQLTIDLDTRLRQAEEAATDLMGRAAAATAAAPAPRVDRTDTSLAPPPGEGAGAGDGGLGLQEQNGLRTSGLAESGGAGVPADGPAPAPPAGTSTSQSEPQFERPRLLEQAREELVLLAGRLAAYGLVLTWEIQDRGDGER